MYVWEAPLHLGVVSRSEAPSCEYRHLHIDDSGTSQW